MRTPRVVGPPRRRGRPRALEPGSRISAWIPERAHDQIVRLAQARDQSVSALIGQVLAKAIPPAK